MKNIVFYAPPAAGKGTQCNYLSDKYGYEVLSIGQVLRNNRNPETEVGRTIIETQDKGILTPDNIVLEALKLELAKYEGKPVIMDGYPRNINQAKLLNTIFENYIVININVDRQEAYERSCGRISCDKCNKVYSKYLESMFPKTPGKCDICGEDLIDRDDDNETAFNRRFDVYEENAPEVKAYFKELGLLREIKAGETKEETSEMIENILKEED